MCCWSVAAQAAVAVAVTPIGLSEVAVAAVRVESCSPRFILTPIKPSPSVLAVQARIHRRTAMLPLSVVLVVFLSQAAVSVALNTMRATTETLGNLKLVLAAVAELTQLVPRTLAQVRHLWLMGLSARLVATV